MTRAALTGAALAVGASVWGGSVPPIAVHNSKNSLLEELEK
ncbi:hypothetical protein [Pseudomonas sp. P105]